jgi:flagella basal body P-ring formation protein FlgA
MSLLAIGNLAQPDPRAWLESQLRETHPEVTEWRIRELGPNGQISLTTVERLVCGALSARSLVVAYGRDSAGRRISERHWFEVAGMMPAVVVTRPLAARSTLDRNTLTVSTVDLLAQRCAPLHDPNAAVGLRVMVSRESGDVLCSKMLTPVPAVSLGGIVRVKVSAGRVALVTEAVARADASIGDRVPLARMPSQRAFWGIVTAPGEVRINE